MVVTVHDMTDAMPPADLLARWRRVPVAVIVDLAPERQISPAIRPLRPAGGQPALFARAVTAQCVPPDFGAVVHALDHVGVGDVLVIAAGGVLDAAMIGDVLGGHLHAKGAAGIVCDGAVRDVRQLAQFDGFAVFARGVNPRGPSSASGGAVNAEVRVGGCVVRAGDWIVGDDDGLAVLDAGALVGLIDKAEAKLTLEADWTAALASGVAATRVFGLR